MQTKNDSAACTPRQRCSRPRAPRESVPHRLPRAPRGLPLDGPRAAPRDKAAVAQQLARRRRRCRREAATDEPRSMRPGTQNKPRVLTRAAAKHWARLEGSLISASAAGSASSSRMSASSPHHPARPGDLRVPGKACAIARHGKPDSVLSVPSADASRTVAAVPASRRTSSMPAGTAQLASTYTPHALAWLCDDAHGCAPGASATSGLAYIKRNGNMQSKLVCRGCSGPSPTSAGLLPRCGL